MAQANWRRPSAGRCRTTSARPSSDQPAITDDVHQRVTGAGPEAGRLPGELREVVGRGGLRDVADDARQLLDAHEHAGCERQREQDAAARSADAPCAGARKPTRKPERRDGQAAQDEHDRRGQPALERHVDAGRDAHDADRDQHEGRQRRGEGELGHEVRPGGQRGGADEAQPAAAALVGDGLADREQDHVEDAVDAEAGHQVEAQRAAGDRLGGAGSAEDRGTARRAARARGRRTRASGRPSGARRAAGGGASGCAGRGRGRRGPGRWSAARDAAAVDVVAGEAVMRGTPARRGPGRRSRGRAPRWRAPRCVTAWRTGGGGRPPGRGRRSPGGDRWARGG